MIPLAEAEAHVARLISALPPRSVPVAEALGLVLAEPVVAREAVPPFANTAMDGFAVRSADVQSAPIMLDVVATVAAGSSPDVPVGPGQAARIMTGAPIPDGADAVVMVERTEYDEAAASVRVDIAVDPGNHLRGVGEDVVVGDQIFAAGERLGGGHLGVLASVGVETVLAYPRPRVGVVSTGDELIDDGSPLAPGQIRDSNRRTLLGLVEQAGFTAVDLGLARDTEGAITGVFERGSRDCDAVLSSGGVSMGAFDYVKVVLDQLGDMRWMQIAIRPAKPFAFGLVEGVPVFGLPGNPVSSMVSFELFARPALATMAGNPNGGAARVVGTVGEPIERRPDGKTHFVRVAGRLDDRGQWTVKALGGQGSHHLTAMAHADALAVVPDGDGLMAGDDVELLVLRTPPGSRVDE